MTKDEIVEVLMGARDMLDSPSHWMKGDTHNTFHNRHCLVGALGCAVTNHRSLTGLRLTGKEWSDIIEPVAEAIRRHLGYSAAVSAFNDNYKTRLTDVRDVLDDAIRDLKGQ